jgi:ATP-dependent Lon protease
VTDQAKKKSPRTKRRPTKEQAPPPAAEGDPAAPPAAPPESPPTVSSESPPESQPPAPAGVAPPSEAQGIVVPDNLPILPIRGTVVFPGTIVPLVVGRPASRKLLDECLPNSKVIALFTQRDETQDEPTPSELFDIGCAVMVLRLIRQPDDTVSIIVHGLARIRMGPITQEKPYLRTQHTRIAESMPAQGELKHFDAMVQQLRDQAQRLIQLMPDAPEQAMTVLMNIDQPGNLADFLAANLNLDVEQKQDLLEEPDVAKRVRAVLHHVSTQLEIARLQRKIQQDVQSSIGDSQRKIYLREQIKAIQKELGEDESGEALVEQLRERLNEAKLPEKVMTEAERELKRLTSIHPASPEYSMLLAYLELLADLPWQKVSEDNHDLDRARRILDRDHYGLQKVKRRLIEYLAVRKLNPSGRGPILCLVGPPGVGKTSLGQSVADALGRRFARLSLGGIRDEAEIRGHRRTYIGSMPGRLIQEIRRAATNNPVMMLDEVDKLGNDFRGDPASALLEVLDPRQNHAFMDRYLDVPFDLSQVMFICTANYMGTVPPALKDRMEVIEIPGYTDNDKLQIARRYLIPRQLKENGLKRPQVRWGVPAVRKVIDDYTREAGVRELERQIGSVCRGIAAEVASNGKRNGRKSAKRFAVDPGLVRRMLGPEKYFRELSTTDHTPGVVIGLAYTPVGGEILFIEATSFPGKGNILITGQLGDVMKESASAAMSLFKSRAATLGYDPRQLADRDVHLHVPAGAVPKDGPSAGVGLFTAITSLLLQLPVRRGVAMTGEITLRGRVLPIGGVKEKTLAAYRAGVKIVVLPSENQRDMEEIDPIVRRKLQFEFVEHVDELLDVTLGRDRLAAHRRGRSATAGKTRE